MPIVNSSNEEVNRKSIILFYIIAIGISVPFHLGIAIPFYQSLTKEFMISEWGYLPACLGPLIAVVVITILDRNQKRTITFLGNNVFKNIIIGITPLVVFTGVGIENEHKNAHYFAFVFSGIALMYGIAEEIAWRGYLQDALKPLHKNIRPLLIGIMWWAWHMRFNNVFDWTVFLLICIGGTFLLIKFTDDTKSYFVLQVYIL